MSRTDVIAMAKKGRMQRPMRRLKRCTSQSLAMPPPMAPIVIPTKGKME